MKKVNIDYGTGIIELRDNNESAVKKFLYSKFDGEKELQIRDEKGNIIDTLKLEDLFTNPI